jgi:hypothetical protein
VQGDPQSNKDFRDDLARIPSGSKLWDVMAIERDGAERVLIGSIVTTSRFVASQYGDEKIFFKHNIVSPIR